VVGFAFAFHAKQQSDQRCPLGAPRLFDLGSPEGERRAEPPGPAGGRLPTAFGDRQGQRREFHEALLEANIFEDLPSEWRAAIMKAEESRPKLRVVSSDGGLAGDSPALRPEGATHDSTARPHLSRPAR
jgi:hypothetical protein